MLRTLVPLATSSVLCGLNALGGSPTKNCGQRKCAVSGSKRKPQQRAGRRAPPIHPGAPALFSFAFSSLRSREQKLTKSDFPRRSMLAPQKICPLENITAAIISPRSSHEAANIERGCAYRRIQAQLWQYEWRDQGTHRAALLSSGRTLPPARSRPRRRCVSCVSPRSPYRCSCRPCAAWMPTVSASSCQNMQMNE